MKWQDRAKEHLIRELDKLLQVEAKLVAYNQRREIRDLLRLPEDREFIIVVNDPAVCAMLLIRERITELSRKLIELLEGKEE